jgi:hypothetical protein
MRYHNTLKHYNDRVFNNLIQPIINVGEVNESNFLSDVKKKNIHLQYEDSVTGVLGDKIINNFTSEL